MKINILFLFVMSSLVSASNVEATKEITVPSYHVHHQAQAESNSHPDIKSKTIIYVPLAQKPKLTQSKKHSKVKNFKRN